MRGPVCYIKRAILCAATPRLHEPHDARVLFIYGQIVRNWCKLLGIIDFQTNKDQTNRFFIWRSVGRAALYFWISSDSLAIFAAIRLCDVCFYPPKQTSAEHIGIVTQSWLISEDYASYIKAGRFLLKYSCLPSKMAGHDQNVSFLFLHTLHIDRRLASKLLS